MKFCHFRGGGPTRMITQQTEAGHVVVSVGRMGAGLWARETACRGRLGPFIFFYW